MMMTMKLMIGLIVALEVRAGGRRRQGQCQTAMNIEWYEKGLS
jgi:hypothetical protein